MNGRPHMVQVTIMGKDYRIACEAHETENLLRSAQELNEQMCRMRDSGKVAGAERIAVMAALNLSHELQSLKHNGGSSPSPDWKESLTGMIAKIENILEKN